MRPWEIEDKVMWDWNIEWWDYCRWQWAVPVDILFGYWCEKQLQRIQGVIASQIREL